MPGCCSCDFQICCLFFCHWVYQICKRCWSRIVDLRGFHNVYCKSSQPFIFANLFCIAFVISSSFICQVFPFHFCIVFQPIWSASPQPKRSPSVPNFATWPLQSVNELNLVGWEHQSFAWACHCDNLYRLISSAGSTHYQYEIAEHHLWFSRTWNSSSI